MRINSTEEISIKGDPKKDQRLSNIKNYYCFKLLSAFGQVSEHEHTVLINECQPKYDITIKTILY